MLAKLFISSDIELRKQILGKLISKQNLTLNHPDLLFFDDEDKLGVEQTKKVKEFLSLKPFSANNKVVALVSAHNLTIQAQNSLLKLLEEPPLNTEIYLAAISENSLLSTIISRCEVVFVEDQRRTKEINPKIEALFKMSIEDRFKYVEGITDKDEFLQDLIIFFRAKMKEELSLVNFTKELLQAEQWAKASVNIRGILEYLMLKFPNKTSK